MPAIMQSSPTFSVMHVPAFACGQTLFGLRPVCAPDRGHHRPVGLQFPAQCRTHGSRRDRQPRRAQRPARQLAGLCGGDGIPRRLHVDRYRTAPRSTAPGCSNSTTSFSPWSRTGNRWCRPTTPSNSPSSRSASTSSSNSARNWFAAARDQPGRGPRMGRQRCQSQRAYGAEQGSRSAFEGLCRAQQADGAADRHQPPSGLSADRLGGLALAWW